MTNQAVELVDVPPPLTLTYRLSNGNVVETLFEPPAEEFFKKVKPGDVLELTVREAREHVTRIRRSPAPAKKTSPKRKR